MMIFNRYQVFWIIAWGIIIGLLFYFDMAFSKERHYIKKFSKNQYEISSLFPLGRTELRSYSQIIKGEPVYFYVYAPRTYQNVDIRLTLDTKPVGWNIGYSTGPGFLYTQILLEEKKEQTIQLELKGEYYDKNRLRFIMSHPDKENMQDLSVLNLSVTLMSDASLSYIEYMSLWKHNLKNAYERLY